MRLTFEDGERALVAARLGLKEDADDKAVAEAMATWVTTEPEKKDDKKDDVNAQTSVDDIKDDDGDVVVVDVSEFKRLRNRDKVAGAVEAADLIRDRNELVEEAISDGKIGPGRRDHYRARYDSDPDGTRKLLARLTPNTVPLEARGADVPTDEVDNTAYPTDWVPEVAARQSRQGGSVAASGSMPSRVHGEG